MFAAIMARSGQGSLSKGTGFLEIRMRKGLDGHTRGICMQHAVEGI